MKTQNLNGLHFRKGTVMELNDGEMLDVDGGTSPLCIIASIFVAGVAYGIYENYQGQEAQAGGAQAVVGGEFAPAH